MDDTLAWPIFVAFYLLSCDLVPLTVIMFSIKPAPNRKQKKSIPVPELQIDDAETTIEVIDYNRQSNVEGIKNTVMRITKLWDTWSKNLGTIHELVNESS